MSETFTVLAKPMKTSASSNTNVHRLKRVSANGLVLAPGSALWIWAGVFLVIRILAFAVCKQQQTTGGVMAAVAGRHFLRVSRVFVCEFHLRQFGTKATFDILKGEVVVNGARHGPEGS